MGIRYIFPTLLLILPQLAGPGCDDAGPRCADGSAAGEVTADPIACVRCTCGADGQLGCAPLPGCGPDAAPRLDRGPRDARVEPPVDASPPDAALLLDADLPDEGPPAPDAGLCPISATVCLDEATLQRCDPNTGARTQAPCPEGTRCVVAECLPPLCPPNGHVCRFGRRVRCDAGGYPEAADPCSEQAVCVGGRCVDTTPDVVLLVDTSTSMGQSVPGARVVERGYPQCEDPAAPHTVLGRVKVALRELAHDPLVRGVRLAVLRFPQTLRGWGSCANGHAGSSTLAFDPAARLSLDAEGLAPHLAKMMVVPFLDHPDDTAGVMTLWTDFQETLFDHQQPCDDACPGVCTVDNLCATWSDPELRPIGGTPLGRSMFVAGEYLRLNSLKEGLACEVDADCGSPHYGCVDGACTDPLMPCRGRALVVFSDGADNQDGETWSWFYPPHQARRLAKGDCEGECLGRCNFTDEQCDEDADCPAPARCVYHRQSQGTFVAEPLRHPNGAPAAVPVSVVAASRHAMLSEIAWWGRGSIQRADRVSVNLIVSLLRPQIIAQGGKDRVLECLAVHHGDGAQP